jgi:hypothetical protein
MKRIYIFIALLFVASVHPLSTHAQFFKNLVNNVKQNMANKATGNQAQTPGKPDSSGRTRSTYDSASLAAMMANINKPKPSISPADSAAAIKSFMTGSGGSGLLYRYLDTYDYKRKQKDSTFRDTMSIAITDSHDTRSDIGLLGMEVIGHAGMPKYSMILYPQNKTYSLNIIDTAAINSGGQGTYQVVKVGNETVQGYHCIHSKLTISYGKGSAVTEDLWTSTEVQGYAVLKKMEAIQNVTPKMMAALDQAGCGGFFIKVVVQSTAFSMTMLLMSADRKNLPASMFQIPPGYVQATNANILSRIAQRH